MISHNPRQAQHGGKLSRTQTEPDASITSPRNAPRLALAFGARIAERVRCRIEYAWRVFCAVYGYRVADASSDQFDTRLCYGCEPSSPRDAMHPVGYVARDISVPLSRPTSSTGGPWPLPCFHPAACGVPDWLGEIFEWLSAADDGAVRQRDTVGRVRFEDGVHGRFQLDPQVPYAAVAMRGLNECLRRSLGAVWRSEPARPWTGDPQCVFAATHDVDFLPLSRLSTLGRLLKNLAIAIHARDIPAARSVVAASATGAVGGVLPLNAILAVRAREQQLGMGSTFNILCRQAHRRDANYSVQDARTQAYLQRLAGEGFELGVHGSYTSLQASGRLAAEYATLDGLGYRPLGGRQHWLRYAGSGLFDELQLARAAYDSTVGFASRAGFRTGASFPYPPYDFERERAYPLLELPLVVMDCALYQQHRHRDEACQAAQQTLSAVREFGWGGVSILWHDTVFGGGQFPTWLGEMYWDLPQAGDRWLSCVDLLGAVWPRFEAAGLVPPLSAFWDCAAAERAA